jgi:hypothetical protein
MTHLVTRLAAQARTVPPRQAQRGAPTEFAALILQTQGAKRSAALIRGAEPVGRASVLGTDPRQPPDLGMVTPLPIGQRNPFLDH